jgi:uncharacterized membrane protein HdeD (DUF308 family)
MQKMGSAIVLIILGLIVLAFPLLGVIPIALITGFLVLILGFGLLFGGIIELGESEGLKSASLGSLEIILGIIALVLGLGFIYNPSLFAITAGFIVYLVGIFLIIVGIVGMIIKSGNSRWNGIVTLIIGILYLIMGTLFVSNPIYLGILIGLWLLITGIIILFQKD